MEGGDNITTVEAPVSSIRDVLGVQSPADVQWINSLIYGDPGVGKTNLLGTAMDTEDTAPLLLIDFDGGVATLRSRTGIDVVSARSLAQIQDIYRELYNSIEGEGIERRMYYKSIGIDTTTEMQKLDMRDIMRQVVSNDPSRDEDVPSMREWGKTQEHVRKIVRGFRDLPCNTFFTAHAVHTPDNATNKMLTSPDLPGKLRSQIAGFLDVVGYMYTVQEDDATIRKIQFAKTERVLAKDRTQALGDVVDHPTIPLLWSKIHP